LGQRYCTPILRQLEHRQITTSPQFGQRNATPFSQGVIGLLQLVHIGTLVASTILGFRETSRLSATAAGTPGSPGS